MLVKSGTAVSLKHTATSIAEGARSLTESVW